MRDAHYLRDDKVTVGAKRRPLSLIGGTSFVATCVIALVAGACGGPGANSPPTVGSSALLPSSGVAPTQSASLPRDLEIGSLNPGAYKTTGFAIPLTITIDDAGWGAQFLSSHLVNVGIEREGGVGEVGFYAVYEVYEPGSSTETMPAPDSLLEWLETVPGLVIANREAFALGGVEGVNLELQVAGDRDVHLIPPPDPGEPGSQPYGISMNAPASLGPGEQGFARHYVFDDIAGGPLLITYFTEAETNVVYLERLIRSVEFVSP